ncbi:CoA transferase, partial [Pseudonocardia sp.]|uniref:CoA transferase n=1 Tax=Pseudonocardia sp. TaxID=60912 RepID=UPI003D0BA317
MRPLEDVRIISLEQYGAGPFGSMHLAELGADIVKVEDPSVGGDVGRHVPPFAEDGDSLFFESFNRDKSSVTLDIRTREGRG